MSAKVVELGTFACIKRLGYGATSVVYLAQYISNNTKLPHPQPICTQTDIKGNKIPQEYQFTENQRVAIKVFKKRATQNLEAELSAYRQLNSKDLVKCFGFYKNLPCIDKRGELVYINCIVLEYVENRDFFDFIANPSLSEQTVRYYFKQLTRAVHYMHSIGIAHYDLKTENIFVDADFNLKLGDFGIATSMSDIPLKVGGTPNYRAPEYLLNNKDSKHHSGASADMFSLGVILFVMIAGLLPFNIATIEDEYYKLLLRNQQSAFWRSHNTIKKKHDQQRGIENSQDYSQAFQCLIVDMIHPDPAMRISMTDLINHPWMQGHTSTYEEASKEMRQRLQKIQTQQ